MDIQRTRTASETGTGGQFDTTHTHLAAVDKTQSFPSGSFVCFQTTELFLDNLCAKQKLFLGLIIKIIPLHHKRRTG